MRRAAVFAFVSFAAAAALEFQPALRLHAELPDGRGSGLCGGTLLGPAVAVTAAHCVVFEEISPFVLATHPASGRRARAAVVEVDASSDVARLSFERPFPPPYAARSRLAPERARGVFLGLTPAIAELRALNGSAPAGYVDYAFDGPVFPGNYTCKGDSGSALLRGDRLNRVSGVLSSGSAVCAEDGTLRYAVFSTGGGGAGSGVFLLLALGAANTALSI